MITLEDIRNNKVAYTIHENKVKQIEITAVHVIFNDDREIMNIAYQNIPPMPAMQILPEMIWKTADEAKEVLIENLESTISTMTKIKDALK